jgi:hypothetical protein
MRFSQLTRELRDLATQWSARGSPRSDYRAVWNTQARTARSAKLGVGGFTDEDHFERTAQPNAGPSSAASRRHAQRASGRGQRHDLQPIPESSIDGWRLFEEHCRIPPRSRLPHASRCSTPQELEVYFRRAGFDSIRQQEDGGLIVTWATKPRIGSGIAQLSARRSKAGRGEPGLTQRGLSPARRRR